LTTPQEYARMKDEYSLEVLKKDEYEKGIEKGMEKSAQKMLAEGIELSLVAKITGLSVEELSNKTRN
jgi:predicted transposase/invertase (TIGR01784 family)